MTDRPVLSVSVGMGPTPPFRRRTVVWLLAALFCLVLIATYDRVGPWGQRTIRTAPSSPLWQGPDSSGPTGLTGDTDPAPPPLAALRSPVKRRDPGETERGDSDERKRSGSDGPDEMVETAETAKTVAESKSRSADGGLKKFQMEDNPAYRPGDEVKSDEGDTTGAIQSKVTSLLAQGASHLISRVLSERQKTAESPRQVDQLTGRAPSGQTATGGRGGAGTNRSGPQQQKNEPPRFTPPHQVLVHLDLKGAPPSVPFLRDVISLSAGLGATGLLIEWEDKFPYSGELKPVTAGNAYTMSQVREIISAAHEHNLTVMPLVQTFGHVEFVLKLPQFAHMREDPSTPQALCPSRNSSVRLVEMLLDQVMEAHPGADRVHIGADEVFVLGRCDLCRRRPREELLLSHIARTARYVRSRYNATAVLWEDMLRNAGTSGLRKYDLDRGLVEPMMWWYTPNVRKYVAPIVWRHAERVYPYVWGAGAYKGGMGSALFTPPIDRHVQNNLDWTDLLAEEDGRLSGGVRGLVLTGWSRYDHFATLPELLAAAVPSLAFNLAAVRRGALDQTAAETAQRALGCVAPARLESLQWPYLYREMVRCRFPGQRVYMMMQRYNNTAVTVREFLDKHATGQESAWLGRYNARHNFTSVLKIRADLPEVRRHQMATAGLLAPLYRALSAIYDRDLVLEWLEQRVLPLLEDLDALERRLESMKDRRDFPVRPLRGYPEHFVRYMDEFVSGWRSSR